ncbi:hypothetical protein BN2475_680011 [Paraburkholderia ribeironis]|uniref:Uncharacterized protein n=1 Tax=Paraburkholderia ribeironis TaxID=1247936 RepID=A0A1N7SI40_9BURK|nr:hypothetical protein BN2475_680011 [Paraburkholderia ribeironis]
MVHSLKASLRVAGDNGSCYVVGLVGRLSTLTSQSRIQDIGPFSLRKRSFTIPKLNRPASPCRTTVAPLASTLRTGRD